MMQAVRLRPWWRPGLPLITLDGTLLVPNDSPESRRRNLLTLYAELARDHPFDGEIPEADLRILDRLVRKALDV